MNKDSLNTMLHDYVQGKLSSEEVKHVIKILKEKPELNKELTKIKEYYVTLQMLEPIKAPDNFLDKVHSKIELKSEPLINKILSPKWLSAEVAGLVVSIVFVIMIINPFDIKKAPTIEYDEVPKPDISQYSVSKPVESETVDSIEDIKREPVKDSKKKGFKTTYKKAKPKKKEKAQKTSVSLSPTVEKMEEKVADKISYQKMESSSEEMEKLEEELKILQAADDEAMRRVAEPEPAIKMLKEETTAEVIETPASPVSKPEVEVKKSKKRRDKDSNKIGSYLAPREKELRELKKKLEELQKLKASSEEKQMSKSSSPSSSNSGASYEKSYSEDFEKGVQERLKAMEMKSAEEENEDSEIEYKYYDTIEKVENVKEVSQDDVTFMIRKNLNTYDNTLLVIDKVDKIFIITMQDKDFKKFKKWLEIKFGKTFTIEEQKKIKDKKSFKLIFD